MSTTGRKLDYDHDPLGDVAYKVAFTPLNDLARICWQLAEDKGFHAQRVIEGVERDASAGERIALIHSEASEMLEALRASGDPARHYLDGVTRKPEGVVPELADVIIRCLDYAWHYGIEDIGGAVWEKLQYNAGRDYRHGNKVL